MFSNTNYLLSEYDRLLPSYQKLLEISEDILNGAIGTLEIEPMQITCRIKSWESLYEKIMRKAGKYQEIHDITDIVGHRVIFYYSDQVDVFSKVLEKTFVVDQYLSSDKRQLIPAMSFGYLSVHYVCTLPKDKGFPEELTEIPFEIQLRSVLQHTWAEIEHELGYKTDFSIPRDIQREFARIASLLEIADDRFNAVRKRIDNYRLHTQETISNDRGDDMTLDLETLSEFISSSPIMTTLVEDIAAFRNCSIREVSPESYLPALHSFNIYTIGELKEACVENREQILTMAEKVLSNYEIDEIISTVGLYYLCKVLEKNQGR